MNTPVKVKPAGNFKHAKKPRIEKLSPSLKAKWDNQAQIAARVAPELVRKPNVIKKVYKEGSPGYKRKLIGGVTLTQLKASINEPSAVIVYGVDEHGQPNGEVISVTPTRDTARVTKRRREMIGREMLGTSNIGCDRRQARNRYAAVKSKGGSPVKKPWHRSGAQTAAKAVAAKKGK